MPIDIPSRLREAVKHYWVTRNSQGEKQGESGNKDAGARKNVTGGKQMDGFAHLIADLLVEEGIARDAIFFDKRAQRTIPGFYRPTKDWDLLLVADKQLWIALELKSQVGSFGNNFNNRVEEGLGNALDIHTAHAKETFGTVKPFVGYFLLLEDCFDSRKPVSPTYEKHYLFRPEFRDDSYLAGKKHVSLSYARRYELFCRKVVLERLYDAAAFMMSAQKDVDTGSYTEPAADLAFTKLVAGILGKAHEYLTTKKLEGT